MAISDIISDIAQRAARVQTTETETAATQGGVAVSRYVAGMTDVLELRGELKALGYTGIGQDRYVLAAELRRQLELFQDRLALWRDQLKKNELTSSEFATLLDGAGLPIESVNLELERATSVKPVAVTKRVAVSLGILEADILTPRPTEAPVAVSLGILEADIIPAAAAGLSRVGVQLRVRVAELAPTLAPVRPVAVSLGIIGVMEV